MKPQGRKLFVACSAVGVLGVLLDSRVLLVVSGFSLWLLVRKLRREVAFLQLALDPLLEQQHEVAEARARQVDDAVAIYHSPHGPVFELSDGLWLARQRSLRFLSPQCALTLILEDDSELRLEVVSHDAEGYPLLVKQDDE